ncbi:hypothetical protein SARC_10027 [Sphaeroforma arctica JP610]|uniref:START domain-containing protein n=1 Tax=Sphaeroforma arctica JP610 TaxID=667725 RepID=A0A0L0FL58_9EUKA|nr:hypothetical protein SARC_10027 [Sphaeroforma arctica JP610]KNC77514.1 hypothetical protein SARC_10027 [Sphaeroforma arctica JP610]|eukprot:XP_014151416.1 hypothetical protein SARC_10027 [Sphaeroforma arctica JP610]
MRLKGGVQALFIFFCLVIIHLASAQGLDNSVQQSCSGGVDAVANDEDLKPQSIQELVHRIDALSLDLAQLKEAIHAAAVEVLPAKDVGDDYATLHRILTSERLMSARTTIGTKPSDDVKLLPGRGAFPSLYKIKTKPYERTMFDMAVSFDVYAGDTYLGEFRQSYPWVRAFWDEIVFWDKHGHFVGQLHFSLLKYLWFIPNTFYGTRYCWLRTADGNLIMHGSEEPFLTLAVRAEQPGIEFQVPGSDRHFKSRMTNTIPPRKWLVVDKDSGDKMATIEESYTTDVFKRHFSGWSVEVPEYTAIDPRVAGFLAAFDLAEEMDTLPSVIRTVGFFLLCFMFPYFFFR